MMLTLPAASRRAALLDALESLVESAGPARLPVPPVTPESAMAAFESGGARRLAMLVFRAAGMAEPEVVMMGGNGAATAFRTQGKVVVRAGSDLPAGGAVVSVIRAAAAMWRQQRELDPAISEDQEVATSAYLSLAAAEASAALAGGERGRAEALVFLLAAQYVARGEPRPTAKGAGERGPTLDVLYEDGLRLVAPRRDELRARFQVDDDTSALSPEARQELGAEPIRLAGGEQLAEALAARPCPCGGRWRVVKPLPEPLSSGLQRVAVACRVCLQWRDVLLDVDPEGTSIATRPS